jgi:hypothetical protein
MIFKMTFFVLFVFDSLTKSSARSQSSFLIINHSGTETVTEVRLVRERRLCESRVLGVSKSWPSRQERKEHVLKGSELKTLRGLSGLSLARRKKGQRTDGKKSVFKGLPGLAEDF